MATGNFDKKLYNAIVYRTILLHLNIILKLTHLHNRLLSGSNARHLSPEDKRSSKSFDEKIINCTYTIQEHLFGIADCSLIMLKDYPQSLTNVNILGQGNLNLVSEKSGKSQGILLSIICGDPEIWRVNASWDGGVSHTIFGSL